MRRIAAQELREALVSWPWYITAAVGLLLAVLLIYNSAELCGQQQAFADHVAPVLSAAAGDATLAMLYIMAWGVLAIARPRDQGALRVLFFAPVDPLGLLGGHLLAGLAVYSLLIALTTPLLVLLAWLTYLPFPPLLLVGALVAPIFALLAVAIGLFLSSVAASSRSAMFLFIGVLLLVLGIQVGYQAHAGRAAHQPLLRRAAVCARPAAGDQRYFGLGLAHGAAERGPRCGAAGQLARSAVAGGRGPGRQRRLAVAGGLGAEPAGVLP